VVENRARSRAKHKHAHLGIGDWEWPASDLRSQEFARRVFLDAVAAECPAVLEDLRARAYEPCCQHLAMQEGTVGDVTEAAALTLRDAVRMWGERWHLTDQWILDAALATIVAWANDAPGGEWWPDAQAAVVGLVGKHFVLDADTVTRWRAIEVPSRAERLVFDADAWEPAAMRWQDWETRVVERFKETLADHRTTIEKRAAEAGMVRTEIRREEHLLWLARYQVGKESFSAIGRAAGVDRAAVARAIKTAATLCGLTLRPAAGGGRPAATATQQ
jgi:hypothetical protein